MGIPTGFIDERREILTAVRNDALGRARDFSPFLRHALLARPELGDLFLAKGARATATAAIERRAEEIGIDLRRRRLGLALSVALGDLAGEFTLEDVTRLLSDFADQAIGMALAQAIAERVPGAGSDGFAIVAMGKLGSHELNYSSDVDLILLFDPERIPRREREDSAESAVRIARRMIEILQQRTAEGYVARVDLRLRPSPEVTPIALSVDAAISYYESSALPWERAAFIRARAAAGDIALGQHFLRSIEPFVWRRSLDYGVIEEIRRISARIRDHFAQGATFGPGYDLKRGRGGIREVEFFVQIQQMIQGGRRPVARCPATLDAISALAAEGGIERDDAAVLAGTYRLLRTIEHRAQMVDDAQTHLLPVERPALDGIARLHGLHDGQALLELLRAPVEAVGRLFDSLGSSGAVELSNDPDLLGEELRAIGFEDPSSAFRRIAEWRSGRSRSLRSPAARTAFEAMLPGLLRAIATGPDPDRALNRFADIVDRLSSGINLYRLLEARPDLARLVARILAHAPALSDQLARRPELLDGLFDASSFDPVPPAADIAGQIEEATRDVAYDVALDRARRLINERRFALGVQLIDQRRDPLEVAQGYAAIAEGALEALASSAVREFEAAHGRLDGGELVILGLGRLGGQALTYASDLDIIYLYTSPRAAQSDGARPLGPADYFNRLASRVTAALSVPTAAGPLYDVDTRLRPEGAKGMLAVSLDAFAAYQRNEAWTWEHMALTRARPVFGRQQARDAANSVIASILELDRDSEKVAQEAAEMRAEMTRHKPPAGALDVKRGPGGLVDLEFAVHVLQLTRRVGLVPRLEDAIDQLIAAGLIPANIADAQRLLTRMLVVMRLVAPDDTSPAGQTAPLVAQLCGVDDWATLVARHDEARQTIAQLWQKVSKAR